MKKKLSLNMILSLLLQLVTIASGLIIPRLILGAFGSEVNGLVQSLNQLLNYISLLEGGVSSVMMASLYKPLIDKNDKRLSSIVKTMLGFFRKLSLVFVVYALALGCIYPLIVKSSFSWIYVFTLTIILGANMLIQYAFAVSYKLLINADNDVYVTAIVQIVCIILNTVLVYVGLKVFPNIHAVKLITAVVFILQPIGYKIYVDRKFHLDKHCEEDEQALSQRWDGFGINLAAFVHGNTDIVVLTAFTDLFAVSVYSVYHLVFNGIKTLLNAIFDGLNPALGKMLAKGDHKELENYYGNYEFFAFSISTVFFAIGAILIVPFVSVYTRNITDTDYNQPVFALIMIVAEFFYCIRSPYLNLAYQSGHFKDISKYAYAEAIINIITSVILVQFLGIIGVAIGTLAANVYRTITPVYFSKKIIKRSYGIFIRYTVVYSLMAVIAYVLAKLVIRIPVVGYGSFIVYGILATVLTVSLFLITTWIFYRENLVGVFKLLHRK